MEKGYPAPDSAPPYPGPPLNYGSGPGMYPQPGPAAPPPPGYQGGLCLHPAAAIQFLWMLKRHTEASQATKTALTSRNVYYANEYPEREKAVHSCPDVHINAVSHLAGAPYGLAQPAVPVTTGETRRGPKQCRVHSVHSDWGIAVFSPTHFYCQPHGRTDRQPGFNVFFQRWMNSPFVSDQKEQLFSLLCPCLPLSSVSKPC